MIVRKKEGSLSLEEKKLIKSLLNMGWRNQDIQYVVNKGRCATINSARITEVKKGGDIVAASSEEVVFFLARQDSYDPKTGLNFYNDERLIRAREAMILAVQVFNSPSVLFKTEVFSMLANVAWTYLMHEYYIRKGVVIEGKDGKTVELSKLLRKNDCPLPLGVVKNLEALKEIRDAVEHKLFRKSDLRWLSIYQACCLNFDKWIVELFDKRLSLKSELSFALQFSKISLEQITELHPYDVPSHIVALDKRLDEGVDEEVRQGTEYKLRVVYTLDSASKSQSHIKFVNPSSEEGKDIKNILLKYKPAEELCPHKPTYVCDKVFELSGVRFSSRNHTQAWKLYKVRPDNRAIDRKKTKVKYCHYNETFNSYTYSNEWIDFLVSEIQDKRKFEVIKAFKIK